MIHCINGLLFIECFSIRLIFIELFPMEMLLFEESDNFQECEACFGRLCGDPLGCIDSVLIDEDPSCTLNEEVDLETQMKIFITRLNKKLA